MAGMNDQTSLKKRFYKSNLYIAAILVSLTVGFLVLQEYYSQVIQKIGMVDFPLALKAKEIELSIAEIADLGPRLIRTKNQTKITRFRTLMISTNERINALNDNFKMSPSLKISYVAALRPLNRIFRSYMHELRVYRKLRQSTDEIDEEILTEKYRELREIAKNFPIMASLYKKFQLSVESEVSEKVDSIRVTTHGISLAVVTLLLILVGLAFIMLNRFSLSVLTPVNLLRKHLSKLSKRSNETSSEITRSSEMVLNACSAQASAVQETVSAMGELSSMVFQTSEKASLSEELTEAMIRKAEKGGITLDNMLTLVDDLDSTIRLIKSETETMQRSTNDSLATISDQISEIVEITQIINDIVARTQILSFNASIEAARAGEHGKGFAVVADEVGALARSSGKAAKSIRSLLKESSHKIAIIISDTKTNVDSARERVNEGIAVSQRASAATRSTKEMLEQILNDINSISGQTAAVRLAAQEQKQGLEQISQSMQAIDSTTQDLMGDADTNAKIASGISNLSHELLDQYHHISQLVDGSTTPNEKSAAHDLLNLFNKKREKNTPPIDRDQEDKNDNQKNESNPDRIDDSLIIKNLEEKKHDHLHDDNQDVS